MTNTYIPSPRDWVREQVGMFDGSLLSSEDSDWSLRIERPG